MKVEYVVDKQEARRVLKYFKKLEKGINEKFPGIDEDFHLIHRKDPDYDYFDESDHVRIKKDVIDDHLDTLKYVAEYFRTHRIILKRLKSEGFEIESYITERYGCDSIYGIMDSLIETRIGSCPYLNYQKLDSKENLDNIIGTLETYINIKGDIDNFLENADPIVKELTEEIEDLEDRLNDW